MRSLDEFSVEIKNKELLDILIIRNYTNKIKLDIFEKDTNIYKNVPDNSHYSSLNFLDHTCLSFSLYNESFEKRE